MKRKIDPKILLLYRFKIIPWKSNDQKKRKKKKQSKNIVLKFLK